MTISSSSSTANLLFPPPPPPASLLFTSVPITRVVRSGYQRSQLKSKPPFLSSSTITRAVDPETNASSSSPDSDPKTTSTTPSSASDCTGSFENRLTQLRLRYRSGTGKKADARKGKKSSSKKGGGGSSGGVFLPPVPLKEAVSGGLKVDFGFSPYTERLNGRVAALGLAALLLVELGSGESLISYHTPPVILIQIYSVAALSAIYVKYHKEKISIWP